MREGCFFYTTDEGTFITFDRFQVLDKHSDIIEMVREVRAFGEDMEGQEYWAEGLATKTGEDTYKIHRIFDPTIEAYERQDESP